MKYLLLLSPSPLKKWNNASFCTTHHHLGKYEDIYSPVVKFGVDMEILWTSNDQIKFLD